MQMPTCSSRHQQRQLACWQPRVAALLWQLLHGRQHQQQQQ
jgi:hypothetical protein